MTNVYRKWKRTVAVPLSLFMPLLLLGCQDLQERPGPSFFNVAEAVGTALIKQGSEYMYCSQSDPEHPCPRITPKTPVIGQGGHHKAAASPTIRQTQAVESDAVRTSSNADTNRAQVANRASGDVMVLFDFDQFTIPREEYPVLDKVAPELQHQVILITGYTDSIGTRAYNRNLAKKRAQSVKTHLVSLGVPANAIVIRAKELCCYLDEHSSRYRRSKNRRAVISIAGPGLAGPGQAN